MAQQEITVLDGLENVRSIEAALAFFNEQNVNVNDNEADGIRSLEIVEDKGTLVKVPFLILKWNFNEGDMGEFVSMEAMLKDGTILVINDGSTGIFKQLWDLTDYRRSTDHPTPQAGRMVSRGLRRSDYDYLDEKTGKLIPATTYYLDF